MSLISRILSGFLGHRTGASRAPQGFAEWSVGGIHFSQDGLTGKDASETSMTWTWADTAEIALTRSRFEEGIQPFDLARYRDEQRRLAGANGQGLVSADVRMTASGVPLLEVIVKARKGLGHDYIGTITASSAADTYTVRITAHETGTTGLREAAVSAQLWELGEVKLPTGNAKMPQRIPGWCGDPYDSEWDETALNSVTDDERLDGVFSGHPLSRVRAFILRVRQSLKLDGPVPAAQRASGDGKGASLPSSQVRRLLSYAAVREILWKHERFAEIEQSLLAQLDGEDGTLASPQHRADQLLLLGIVRARQDKHRDALDALSQALEIFSAPIGGDRLKRAIATAHTARAELELQNHARARALFMESIPTLEAERPGQMILGMALSGYGRLLIAQGDGNAIEYVMRANAIMEALGGGRRFFLLQESAGAPAPMVSAKTVLVGPK